MQERDNRKVAADGAAGDCVFAEEPFRRFLQIAYRTYWVRELQKPRSFYSGLVQQGELKRTTRTGSSAAESTQGGEQRARGRRRHRALNLSIGAAGARCKGRS